MVGDHPGEGYLEGYAVLFCGVKDLDAFNRSLGGHGIQLVYEQGGHSGFFKAEDEFFGPFHFHLVGGLFVGDDGELGSPVLKRGDGKTQEMDECGRDVYDSCRVF